MSDQLSFSGHYAFGFVEEIDDPLKAGRVQVRLIAIHSDDHTILPTEDLPWCQVILPVTSNEASSHGIRIGHCVKCIFLDGIEMQIPVVDGILPGMMDDGKVSMLGMEDKTLSKYADGRQVTLKEPLDPSQPPDPYAAKYPYNHVFETATGHRIEVDDTPGAERVHIFHSSGSNTEFHPNGDHITTTQKDEMVFVNGECVRFVWNDDTAVIKGNMLEQVDGNREVNVAGEKQTSVKGNMAIIVSGNVDIKTKGNMNASVVGNVKLQTQGDAEVSANGNVKVNAGGNMTLQSSGNVSIISGGNIAITAAGTIAMS